MYTREDLKNLTDEQMIQIANVLEPREDWQVSKKFTDEQHVYEVVVDGGEGQYIAIVQILWGEEYDTESGDMDRRYLIRHFDADFMESGVSDDELNIINNLIDSWR